jgi:hypothetical protein
LDPFGTIRYVSTKAHLLFAKLRDLKSPRQHEETFEFQMIFQANGVGK